MSVNPISAANAYATAARALRPAAPEPTTGLAEQGNFSGLLQAAYDNVSSADRNVEANAAGMSAGKTDTVGLVTAVAESELAVDTLVTVRDRVIAAYQEILNMPI